MQHAESQYGLHSYSDGGAGLMRMLRDLFGSHDPNAVDALEPSAVQGLQNGLYKRSAPAAPAAFYRGMSHQQLYNSVTQGVDAGQLGDIASAWNQSSEELLNATQGSASKALAASELTWQGQAGNSARASVAKLANQAGQAGQASQVSAQLFQQQSTALAHAKNSIPKPPAQPFSVAAAQQKLATVTDPVQYMQLAAQDHAQFAAQQQAQQQAAQIVQSYDKVVTQTSRNQPAFAPAPEVAKNSPGQSGQVPQVHSAPSAPSAQSFAPMSRSTGSAPVSNTRTSGTTDGPPTQGPVYAPVAHGPQPSSPPSQIAHTTDPSQFVGPPQGPSQSNLNGPSGTNPYGPRGVNPADPFGGGIIGPVGGGGGLGNLGGDMPRTGSGFGPTGGGSGGVGSGGGSANAGRSGGGSGEGGQAGSGARSGAGAAAAEEAAVGRGAAGARGASGATGGMAPGARGGKGGQDEEHKRPSYLVESDPEDIFGVDEKTAPPVIG